MKELMFGLALVVVATACLMEALKSVIEGLCNKIKKRPVDVPAFVWWLSGALFSASGTVLALHVLRTGEATAPLLLAADPWAAFLWTPIVWWLQMHTDMKLVKGWLVPLVKKLIERKMDRI